MPIPHSTTDAATSCCLRRARQHHGADADANHRGSAEIEREIPTCSDARLKFPRGKPGEGLRPDPTIALVLEGPVEQIVKRCTPLIAVQQRRHQKHSPAQ